MLISTGNQVMIDGVSSHADRSDLEDLSLSDSGCIASEFGKRSFLFPDPGQDLCLKDHLRLSRIDAIDGFSFEETNGFSHHPSHHLDFIYSPWRHGYRP